MQVMGIPESFIQLTRMLLEDASASVSVNNKLTDPFPIRRGVRQGCPLAPYLFLIVGEALHAASLAAMASSNLTGITLPGGLHQQLVSQYADDISHSLAGTTTNLRALVSLLSKFHLASGISVNWIKSVAYWFGKTRPPDWTRDFDCV